ncbi:hypothetical protein [Sphingopyxis sp. KK2]|uniref:hypothetical protein n=1 Tax=Sphingopyxis sp. KK2 TaxID=1855727 RepID=UPI00097E5B6D|nr:hypothetical protein [Sphingopyxis sp. KK2]
MAMLALMTMTPAAAIPLAPPSDAVEEEIVVIASKLKDWRAALIDHRGETRCYTQRSTGDAAIDRIGCQSMLRCHTRYAAEFESFKDHRIPSNKRSATRKKFLRNEFSTCVFAERDAMVADLAEKRSAQ